MVSKADLATALRDAREEHDKWPIMSDLDDWTGYSVEEYEGAFGSYSEALKVATSDYVRGSKTLDDY